MAVFSVMSKLQKKPSIFLRTSRDIETVKRHRCDLVFMASHGRRGLSRLIAGSVTQRVLAYSPVPVMVYRPGLAHTVPEPNASATARPQA